MKRPWTAAVALAAAAAGAATCSSDGGPGQVVISEIMYHPVLEAGPVDEHEFVEIHNRGARAVALGGWRLAGGVKFTFPAGTSIGPGEYLVVAQNRDKLLAVARYGLTPAQVVGSYEGELDNDGDQLAVADAAGSAVDTVRYGDSFPWPVGADARGAGEGWLEPENLPLEDHRFMGRSLERVSVAHAGTSAVNWAPSPLDGATPGRRNSAARAVPRLIVESIEATPAGKAGRIIRASEQTRVRLRLGRAASGAAGGELGGGQIEFFVENQEKTDEPVARAPLAAQGEFLEATLPAQPDNAVVRYRVVGDRGDGMEVISPRPSDPYRWHSYFVTPGPNTEGVTPIYQLFITKARWEELWDNIEPGRVPGNGGGGNPEFCTPNWRWDDRVPAILVIDGQVFDVQARYQGSRSNRTGGPPIMPDPTRWPMDGTRPDRPSPRALSWHFNFPRWARFEGLRGFNLVKMPDQSCQGFFVRVGNALFESVGIPATHTRYVRLHINGSYYHYTQRMERLDEDVLRRFFGKGHQIGDLFKSEGARWDEGPYGWGDERPLRDHCGFTADQRYAWTYKRATNEDWKSGSPEVRKLIEDLHAARAAGMPAMRQFLGDHFDLEALRNYMAVRNWLSPWDDVFQNHFLYRKADGKWMVFPTDLDNHFGFSTPSASDGSFFSGVENSRSSYRDYLFNFIKDTYLRAYRDEFIARIKELSNSVLHPNNVLPLIDDAAAEYDVTEARAAPAGVPLSPQCGGGDPNLVVNRMKQFVRERHERVLDGLFD